MSRRYAVGIVGATGLAASAEWIKVHDHPIRRHFHISGLVQRE